MNAMTTSLQLDRVIFDGDKRLRRELSALETRLRASEPVIDPMAELGESLAKPLGSLRAELLRNAMRLPKGLAPTVWRAVGRCVEVLGVTTPIELYVVADPSLNAFVGPLESGRVIIGFTSTALEKFDASELAFIVGHELGHVLYDHHGLGDVVGRAGDLRIAPADALRLSAWRRYAELTADRVGMLCCDDMNVAVVTQFKMFSGLAQAHFVSDAKAMAAEFTRMSREKLAEQDADWIATHPYGPLRVRALDLFARSNTYASLAGRTSTGLTERELESEVEAIMAVMNPSCLDEAAPNAAEMREFLALAGLAVAQADKRVDDLEQAALDRFVGTGGVAKALEPELRQSRPARTKRLGVLAEKLKNHTSPLRRKKLLEDLCTIARADKHVDTRERTALQALAGQLGFGELDVAMTFASLDAPMD